MDGRGQRTKRVLEPNSRTLSIGIIGGGLVGALAAISLAKVFRDQHRPVQIELFERYGPLNSITGAELSSYQAQYDARNLVLSSVTAEFFQAIDIWESIQQHLVPIEVLNITRHHGRGRSRISAEDEGVNALGYVADMGHLAVQLTELAKNQPEIICYFNAEITKLIPLQTGYAASIDYQGQSQEKRFDLIVAADGQNSWVCQHLGLKAVSKAYKQHALVANVSMDRPMPNIAYEQFINGGAITLLPLTQSGFPNRMALVWIDTPEHLSQLQNLSDAAFMQKLAQYLPLDAVFSKKGHSKIYPLYYQLRDERVRPYLVVIGNAAQSLHPIAAQGFNLAVRDIRDFVGFIEKQTFEALFSGVMMQQFAIQRASDVRKVRRFVDALNSAFFIQKKTFLSGFLQDTALLGFELIPGAKAGLSRFAMGGRKR